MKDEFNLSQKSFVVEIASNDGYLLKYFQSFGIECLGVEPAENVAKVARMKGINTENDFFSIDIADSIIKKYRKADLIIANNVFAHVPNINDFTSGIKKLLSENGIFTIEVPYLKNLVEQNQFDTIYHEHYFYFTFTSIKNILEYHNLIVFDVEKLDTHGGSLRIFAKHLGINTYDVTSNVAEILSTEKVIKINNSKYYIDFVASVQKLKYSLLKLLIKIKENDKIIVGYGAPGKGNTLLNYCGIGSDLIDFTVDKNPYKQNTLLPGSRIPVIDPSRIKQVKPDYILILPWNLKDEIISELEYVKEWGAQFIIPIPNLEII
jgi:SAM-dependent methyltransferase